MSFNAYIIKGIVSCIIAIICMFIIENIAPGSSIIWTIIVPLFYGCYCLKRAQIIQEKIIGGNSEEHF